MGEDHCCRSSIGKRALRFSRSPLLVKVVRRLGSSKRDRSRGNKLTPKSIRAVLNQLPELTKKKEIISLLPKSLDFGISACVLINTVHLKNLKTHTSL